MKRFIRIVKTLDGVRSNTDGRRRVDRIIAEYRDKDGTEYRKGFEVSPGEPFECPREV